MIRFRRIPVLLLLLAFFVNRSPDDLFQGSGVNYHYLLVEVDHGEATVTMNRIELNDGKATWIQPDQMKIMVGPH